MEKLGNEVYKNVLEQSEQVPYAPGAIEDFQLEPQPTYIFTVPLQPEVTLGVYRDIRLDYEVPEVTDEAHERAMVQLQQREALVEDSQHPIQSGDRVIVDIHSEFTDGLEEGDEAAEEDIPLKGASFVHEHDAEINLDPENEPILPGLIDALVGANIDADLEFELTVPDDKEGYEKIAERKVQFNITIKKVQNVTLPELNDELAARVTEKEDDSLTLLELRARVRENLQIEAEREAETAYGNSILDLIVEQADISYHELMIDDRIHEMIEEFDAMLHQQNLTLESYQQLTGVTHEQLHEQYHDEAIESLERTLVMGEVLTQEEIKLSAEDIEAEIEKTLLQFGEQAEIFRQFFDTPEQRQNIGNNLLFQHLMERLVKIGKGESLEEEDKEETTADEVVAEATDDEIVASAEETEISEENDNQESDTTEENIEEDSDDIQTETDD
jgi:trigger factor